MSSPKERWRLSGKKVDLPRNPQKKWTFTLRPGSWVIAESSDGERRRFALSELRTQLGASLDGVLWQGELLKVTRSASGQSQSGDSDLTAQFPGKVRKILVSAGTQVNEGESLILVEAMKMEFAVKAPSRGLVKSVLVKEGQQLSPGDRFFDFVSQEVSGG